MFINKFKSIKIAVNIRIYNLLQCVVYKLCSLLPLQNKVVATAFQGKKYGDNPAYILEAINRNKPGLEIIWMVDGNFEMPRWIKGVPLSLFMRSWYHYATAKVIIDTHHFPLWTKKRKGQLFIETWHGGLGIKKLELEVPEFKKLQWLKDLTAHTCKMADVFISQSDHLSRIYKSAFHYEGEIYKCGYPKNDILIQRDETCRKSVRDYFNVDSNTKIFLYAPTYRNEFFKNIDVSPFLLDTEKLVQILERKFGGKWVIMCRWHPKFAERMMAEYKRRNQTAVDATSFQDVQKLLLGVDAVMSDYSSIIFDAVLLDIPCFTYATDFETYKAERGVYYEMDELPFPYARNNDELVKNIETYDHEMYLKKWNAFKIRTGLYEPGNASEVIAKKIVDFIQTGHVEWN